MEGENSITVLNCYPGVLFCRLQKFQPIDNFIQSNHHRFRCNIRIIDPINQSDLLHLFSENFPILVTYGDSVDEYIPLIKIPSRMNKRWFHISNLEDINEFNRSVMYCFVNNVIENRELTRPIFSVFTTCYHSYEKIFRAYASLQIQKMMDWEWIIIDDSDDIEHFNFLKLNLNHDPRIRLYNRNRNSGNIGNVKNEAIGLCRGKYLIEFDHDDELMEDTLFDATTTFDQNPEIGFLYFNYANIYEDLKNFQYGDHFGLGYCGYYMEKWIPATLKLKLNKNEINEKDIEPKWIYVASSANINNITMSHIVSVPNHPRIWRRNLLNEIGSFSEYLPICNDQEILMRTVMKTKIGKIHKLGYIKYLSNTKSNMSFVRNAEITRIGPILKSQFYTKYALDDFFKEKNAYEIYHKKPIWLIDDYVPTFINSIFSGGDCSKIKCFLGVNTFLSNLSKIHHEFSHLDGIKIFIIDNTLNVDELCEVVDNSIISNAFIVNCYSLPNISMDIASRYFRLICQSVDNKNIEYFTDIDFNSINNI